MVTADDEGEKDRKACGEAVLAVMKTCEKKKKVRQDLGGVIDKHL